MTEAIEIKGGADPYITAAIMAALQVLWDEEITALDNSTPLAQEAWVMAGRTRPTIAARSAGSDKDKGLRRRPDRDLGEGA